MAMLMVLDASNDTLAHYDEVITRLEATGYGQPAGWQFQVAARKGASYVVTDMWESQEALDLLMEVHGPLEQQAGGNPDHQAIQILETHNVIKGA